MVYCSLPLVAQPLQRSSLQSISLLPSKAVAVHCVGHQEGMDGKKKKEGMDGIRRTLWQLFSLSTFPTMKSRGHHARVLCTFPSFWGNWDFCLVHLRQNLPDTGTLISNIGDSERITGFSAALSQHLFSPATRTDGNTFPTPHPPPQTCHLPCLLPPLDEQIFVILLLWNCYFCCFSVNNIYWQLEIKENLSSSWSLLL